MTMVITFNNIKIYIYINMHKKLILISIMKIIKKRYKSDNNWENNIKIFNSTQSNKFWLIIFS